MVAFGKELTPIRFISALVSWGEVGNSNWYVTAILSLYAISWLSFKLFAKQQLRLGVLATFILSIVLVLIFMHFRGHDATYAYNTILCFPAGMIFSLYKDPLEKLFVKSIFTWAFSLSASALIFLVSYRLCTHFSFAFNFALYQVMAISFPVMLTIF
ncbi:MAG: hypothetical protein IJV62_02930, partial [Eggerthellaceae bacterium]|nr:hypothetical protein [Eggerthellaceae bacterium]